MRLRNVTLEISAKPFMDDSEAAMFAVGRKMFTQWKNLTDAAEQISVMLWVADGSEILNWSGDLDQTFEWACWQGCAEAMVPQDHDCQNRGGLRHRGGGRHRQMTGFIDGLP